jgi:hypothetical protein
MSLNVRQSAIRQDSTFPNLARRLDDDDGYRADVASWVVLD